MFPTEDLKGFHALKVVLRSYDWYVSLVADWVPQEWPQSLGKPPRYCFADGVELERLIDVTMRNRIDERFFQSLI